MGACHLTFGHLSPAVYAITVRSSDQEIASGLGHHEFVDCMATDDECYQSLFDFQVKDSAVASMAKDLTKNRLVRVSPILA